MYIPDLNTITVLELIISELIRVILISIIF